MPRLLVPRARHISLVKRRSISVRRAIDKHNCLTSIRPPALHQSPATQTFSGPLSGTTHVLKDNIATVHEPTTCALAMLSAYTSPFDATVVSLLKNAGLSLIAKLNLDEFAMGAATVYSHFGPTTNPRYKSAAYVAGGSSGGSAAAVAAGLCSFALGTDTGGSVRVPATYCDVVGFKPSYGRVSRWGVVPYAQSLDTIGILSPDIDTASTVFSVLDKYDDKDPTSLPPKFRSSAVLASRELPWIVGVCKEMILQDLSEDALCVWRTCLKRLLKAGHTIRPISLPSVKKLLPAYYSIATAEAASNLSRYDGVRYGYRAATDGDAFEHTISRTRAEGFGPEVQRRIMLGNFTLSSSSGDHLARANAVRPQLTNEFNNVFAQRHPFVPDLATTDGCDVIVGPTSISKAPSLQEYLAKNSRDLLNGYVNDVLVVPASLAGLPAISVPTGQEISIQVMAQYGDDHRLLEFVKTALC